MATTSLVEQSPANPARPPVFVVDVDSGRASGTQRRAEACGMTQGHPDSHADRSRGRCATDAPTASGSVAPARFRWALAFYGGPAFIPLGTFAATWFTS